MYVSHRERSLIEVFGTPILDANEGQLRASSNSYWLDNPYSIPRAVSSISCDHDVSNQVSRGRVLPSLSPSRCEHGLRLAGLRQELSHTQSAPDPTTTVSCPVWARSQAEARLRNTVYSCTNSPVLPEDPSSKPLSHHVQTVLPKFTLRPHSRLPLRSLGAVRIMG